MLEKNQWQAVSSSSCIETAQALEQGDISHVVMDSEILSGENPFNGDIINRLSTNPLLHGVFILDKEDASLIPAGCDFVLAPWEPGEVLLRLKNKADTKKLAVLHQIRNIPYGTTDTPEVCREFVRILADSLHRGSSVALHMKGEEDKPHQLYVQGEIHREDLKNLSRFVTGVAMIQKKPLIYEDLRNEEFWTQSSWNQPESIKNVVCIPIRSGGRITGTLELYNVPRPLLQDYGNNENPEEFLSLIVREFEKVLEFTTIYEKQKSDLNFAVDELSLLYEISNALTSTLDLDEMLQFIVKNALESFSARVVSLMLLDRDKKELSIRFAEGLTEDIIRNARVKIGEGVAGRVASSGEPLLLVDMMGIDSVDIQKDIKSALSVPLKIRNEVIGVLNVSKTSRYQFTETDLKLLFNMASLAAQAIEKASLYEDIKDSLEELKSSYMNTVKALSKAIEAKDPYTQGHVDRVAKYGLSIAMQLNQDLVRDEFFRYALILHDIGKIEIPDTILNKRGGLDPEEMAIMRRHPEAGARIIKPVKFLKDVADMVRYHQERYDGKGYPKGLRGEEIPLVARIISVADAFDAITSDRPYRKARSVAEAMEEIKKHAGSQFDPAVVEALCQALEKKIIP